MIDKINEITSFIFLVWAGMFGAFIGVLSIMLWYATITGAGCQESYPNEVVEYGIFEWCMVEGEDGEMIKNELFDSTFTQNINIID